MIKNLLYRKKFNVKRLHTSICGLILMVLLCTATSSQAQLYYLTNNATPGSVDALDAINKINYDGTGQAVVLGNVALSPILMELDIPNNRAFIYEGYSTSPPSGLSIKVINLSTGAVSATIPIIEANSRVTALQYDAKNDYLYYLINDGTTAASTYGPGLATVCDALIKVKPDGTDKTIVKAGFSKHPTYMALDVPNDRVIIYQNLFLDKKFFIIKLSTGEITSSFYNIPEEDVAPYVVMDIAYDAASDYIYFLSSNNKGETHRNDALRKIHTDGTGATTVATIKNAPTSMTLDASNNRAIVYSLEYTNQVKSNVISSVNLTTGEITPVKLVDNIPASVLISGLYASKMAILSTAAPTGISSGYTTLGGNITRSDAAVTERGIVFSSSNTAPVIGGTNVTKAANGSGNGSFTASITGLSGATTYYARAYATSSAGTAYGNAVTFTTLSNNTNLSNISLSGGTTLSPVFSAGVTNYTANVTYNVTSITLTPTKDHANAAIQVAGTPVNSGTASAAYPLSTGANTINTEVTAQDGITKKTYTITVTRAQTPQTITLTDLPVKTYGEGNFTPAATTSSGLALTYASDNTTVATVDNTGIISIKGAGTANITVSQAGNATYLAASPVTKQLTINKATLTYTADTTSRNYGAANTAFTGTVSGFVYNDTQATATTGTLAFSSTANVASTVGAYAITGSGLTAANYTFVQAATNAKALEIKKPTVTYTAQAITRQYGQANPVLNVTFTGFANGQTIDQVVPAYSNTTTATVTSAPGNYPIQVSGLAATNYNFVPAASNATALTITKAVLTFTAQVVTRRYGEANPTLTGEFTGFVNGESVANLTGTPVYSTTATQSSNAGQYPITLSGVSSNNYTIITAGVNTAAISVSRNILTYAANPVSRAFNNINPELTGTVTGFVNGDTQNLATSGTLVFDSEATPTTPVGSYAINGSGLTAANYDFVQAPANSSAFSIYLSTNGDLSNMALSQGTLSPAFNPATKSYTATVSAETTSTTVTPTLSDPNARVTVNGTAVTSGNPSANIALVTGPNNIPVNVTAQDGTNTNPYNIVVTRLPSTDASLASLTSNTGTMTPLPGYDYWYIDTVATNVSSINLTAITNQADATIYLQELYSYIQSGAATAMPLVIGTNNFTFSVVAQDGINWRYYNVRIIRRPSDNNLLSNLAVSGKSISPAFSSGVNNYTLDVDNETSTIDIAATLTDNSASFNINGYSTASGTALTYPISTGQNEIPIQVYSQSGKLNTYILTVNRAKSAINTLADIGIITPGTIDKPFNNDTLTYEYHVAGTQTVFKINPEAVNSAAGITINGEQVNRYNGYTYTIKYFSAIEPIVVNVTSEDGTNTKTFTINLVRDFTTDATLADMYFYNGPPLSPAFDKNTFTYTATVTDPAQEYVMLYQQSTEVNTEVRINGISRLRGTTTPVNLKSGENNIMVSVKSFGGTENLYTIKLHRVPGVTAALSGIVLAGNNGSYSNVVSVNENMVYYATAPNAVTTLNVLAYASDAGAEVKVNGNVFNELTSPPLPLNVGDNEFAIAVTSADGANTKAYTLHVNRLPFADVSLASLSVNKGTISPVFVPGTTIYNVTTANSDTSITVIPIATDPTATITLGVDTISASKPSSVQEIGEPGTQRQINIRVTAADGVTNRIYRLRANRPAVPNAYLSGITLSNGSVSPVFAQATTTYNAAVAYEVSSVIFTPAPSETGAGVTVNHNGTNTTLTPGSPSVTIPLTTGSNVITTTVTAPNHSSTTTYTVTITRAAPSAIATLSSLAVNSGTLSPAFSSSTDVYAVEVPFTTDTISITTAATHAGATIIHNDAQVTTSFKVALPVGETQVPVLVKAQDGSTNKTYTLNITRLGKSADAALAGLFVNEGILNPVFTPGNLTYSLAVNESIDSLAIAPITANAFATVTVNGKTPNAAEGTAIVGIVPGLNTITVLVTAEDSVATQSYTINVTRAVSVKADLTGLSLNIGTLNPVFNTGMLTYAANVANTITKVSVKPVLADPTSSVQIRVNGGAYVPATNNVLSAQLKLNLGVNPVDVLVTAADNSVIKTYTINVKRLYSVTDATLAELSLSNSTISPAFVSNVVAYKAFVDNATDSTVVRAVATNPDATITINGITVDPVVDTVPMSRLAIGTNYAKVVVTSANGAVSKTYQVKISRAPGMGSGNADVVFSLRNKPKLVETANGQAMVNYIASVDPSTTFITVTPTSKDVNAQVQVNDILTPRGQASAPINLTGDTTIINITSTAQNGVVKTYSIAVVKQGSNNPDVALVVSNNAVLVKGTSSSTQVNLTTSVNAALPSVTVTATSTDPNAAVRIQGILTPRGATSAPIALTGDTTMINVVSTAQDGITTRTYSIAVLRRGSNNAELAFTLSGNPKLVKLTSGPPKVNYITSVDPSVPLTVTTKSVDGNAQVTIQGVLTARNTPSAPIALVTDTTMINIVSTAQDGVTVNTYSVAVLKQGSNNADIALALSGNPTLTKVGASTDQLVNYTTTVGTGVTSVNVTATAKDANATVTIQGMLTPRGQASVPIALTNDTTTVTIIATAQDGVTTRTYTIAVVKPGGSLRTSDITAKSNVNTANLFEQEEKEISIYPNPFVDNVSIELKGYNASQAGVVISTMQGNVVYNRTLPVNNNLVALNLTDLRQGVYIINITINGQRKAYRIFKN